MNYEYAPIMQVEAN